MGSHFRVWVKGEPRLVGGTSASAPTFAAVIALLNDIRISEGKAPLGFLNPWLYSQAFLGLNDIEMGNNPGCGTQGFSVSTDTPNPQTHFEIISCSQAVPGWDPVTGLGTPDFGRLRELMPQ